MKRVIEEELLDADLGTPAEITASLKSIQHVNRWYGGNRVHIHLLRQAAKGMRGRTMHILEVAAGHANVLQAAAAVLIRDGMKIRVTLLDRSAQHLPGEQDWGRSLPQPEKIEADALRIPLADNSVDVVSCCLFLHHLDNHDAVVFLRESLRVARVAVIINDLERTRLHYLLARLYALMDPSRLSKYDGPVSVRRSYTLAELRQLLGATKCEFELRRSFLCRLAAIVWKQPCERGSPVS